VAAGNQDSFQTTFNGPELSVVVAKYAGLRAPLATGASLEGFQRQPSCSWVPPTDTTNGELAGHTAVGNGMVRPSFACLPALAVPASPAAPKKLSFLARPCWNTASNFEVCAAAAPPKSCSAAANDIEKTVPGGVAAISPEMALNRLGKPWTPTVSAGGTARRTMLASGAIEYAHSMSRVASNDHPAAALGPDWPWP